MDLRRVDSRTFYSRWVTPELSPRLAFQQHWLQWLGALSVISMSLVVLREWQGANALLWLLVALGISFALAWVIASTQFHGRVAAIVVDGNVFRLRTLHDLAFQPDGIGAPFPLSFAAPQRQRGGLQIHYVDRVIVLRESEWAEFTALVAALTNPAVLAPADLGGD